MKEFNTLLQKQFDKMCKTGKLFSSAISGREVWKRYLAAFKEDPIFRDPESSTHNCNLCNNFIRRYGNILAIDDKGNLMSLFDVKAADEFAPVVKDLSKALKSSKIEGVFFETFAELNSLPYESCKKTQDIFRLGIDKNHKRYTKEEAEKFGVVKPDEIRTFHHMHLDLPKQFVDVSGKSQESIIAEYRDKYTVFKRASEELPMDTLILVKDLIKQGSLLDGDTHLHAVEDMISLLKAMKENTWKNRDNLLWEITYSMPERTAKFKNTLIGVLCTELAEGEELNKACENWNKRVDPANYLKAVAPITKAQKEQAAKFVKENGYEQSFDRRFATIDDIKASEIKHINEGSGEIKEASMFDNIKTPSTRHKRSEFDKVEEISIDKFMEDILPNCTSVEAFLENRMEGNMVTMTTSNVKDSKPVFKWNNNYSWTYKGNLAGKSQLKEAVKSAGGKVDGILRFSIMWAEKDGDNSDLDAHCKEPQGFEIYFRTKKSPYTMGNLDIDITNPQNQRPEGAVENITYPSLSQMDDGKYRFFIHQYVARSSKGFKAEIEFNGEIYSYESNKPVSGNVNVATVTLKDGKFSIEHHLPETNSSKEIYGLETNNFHKVNLMCLSPNHWGENNVGNKHYFFMLEGCQTKSSIRSFHNENLIPELLKHRKVMDVLGNVNMIESKGKHLAGLGFNATVKDELIVKCKGSFNRMLKLKF